MYTIQQLIARKGIKQIWFISDDAYEKMRKVVCDIVRKNDEDRLEFADLNQCIPDEWFIYAKYKVIK